MTLSELFPGVPITNAVCDALIRAISNYDENNATMINETVWGFMAETYDLSETYNPTNVSENILHGIGAICHIYEKTQASESVNPWWQSLRCYLLGDPEDWLNIYNGGMYTPVSDTVTAKCNRFSTYYAENLKGLT